MASVLVDTNVLLDVFTNDPLWVGWSSQQLMLAAARGTLIVNVIVLGELAPHFLTWAALDQGLPAADFLREDIPFEAGFLAGLAYQEYRKRGGSRTSPIPDFFIGAHAAVRGYSLLTRDARRYRSYFPAVKVIAP